MGDKICWLTGCSGFIGKYLVKELKKNNFKLRCFSNNSILRDNPNKIKDNYYYMDFSSKKNITRHIENFGCPDIFIHLGWGNMESPMSTHHLTDNVKEAEILIDSFYSSGIEKFVFLGSMNEYGARVGPLSEDMEPKGRLTNYAKGKIKVAKFGFSRSAYFGRKFIHIRPFYVYGPGQRKWSLINTLFDAFQEKTPPKLGPCEHYRDYIYVKDVAEGIVRLIKINTSCTINLGSGSFIMVKDFVKKFWDGIGGEMKSLKFGSRQMSDDEPEQPKSYADLTRLKKMTKWKPNYSLEEGIQGTIKNY